MASTTSLLLVNGSLRSGSTNGAALRAAADLVPDEVDVSWFPSMAELPHFNPDDDHDPLPPAVVDLRAAVARAGALLVCTPEYAGDMPGSLKNLLDWTVGGMEVEGLPTAWINVSSSPNGAAGTHQMLRAVLTYTGARIVEDACVHVPVPRLVVDGAGRIADPAVRAAVAAAVTTLVAAAR